MRAKLDENLPVEAAELLRTAGWECDTVHAEGLAGTDDSKVAAACQAEARVLAV
jgi:predicted nuclease of predicted toxin-antitoxin system